MGGKASKAEATQQKAAKDAVKNLCDAVAKAILEIAKLEGLQSESDVLEAKQQVLSFCNQQANASTKELTGAIRAAKLQNMFGDSTGSGDATALHRKLTADLLFLELIRAAIESGGDSSGSGGSGNEVSSNTIAHPWTRKEELGKGAFGCVYSAVDKNGFKFAVKEVPRAGIEEKSLRDEVKFLGRLSHRNIIKFYGCAGDKENFFMYIELMEGSIRDEITRTESPIPNNKAVRYTRDLLQGLIYLHSKSVVHRDIKCANILLDKSGVAKLADMGISKIHDHATMLDQSEEKAGTICWMSPEVLSGSEAGKRSDVWSVGCAVYEMVKGLPPFAADLPPVLFVLLLPRMIMNLEHGDLVRKDETLGPKLKDFLMKIFVKMDKRPFAETIAKHSWLQ